MKLLVRWIIVAVALVAAVALIPGIRVEDTSAWIVMGRGAQPRLVGDLFGS